MSIFSILMAFTSKLINAYVKDEKQLSKIFCFFFFCTNIMLHVSPVRLSFPMSKQSLSRPCLFLIVLLLLFVSRSEKVIKSTEGQYFSTD